MELRTKNSQNMHADALNEDQATLMQFLDSKIKHKKKKYKSISDATRNKLIHLTKEAGMSVKRVAKKLRINYSTAKSICKIYSKEGRIGKKAHVNHGRGLKKEANSKNEASTEEVGGKVSPQEKLQKGLAASVKCKKEEVEAESIQRDSSINENNQNEHNKSPLASLPSLRSTVGQFRAPVAQNLDNQLNNPSLKLEPNSQLLAQMQLAQINKLGISSSQFPLLGQSLFQNLQALQVSSPGNATSQSIYSMTALSPIVQSNTLARQMRTPPLHTNNLGLIQNWSSMLSRNIGPNIPLNLFGTTTPLTSYSSQVQMQKIRLLNLLRYSANFR